MKKGDILVSLWVAMSAALVTQVDFDALNLPQAKAQKKEKAQRIRPRLGSECKGDASNPVGARKLTFCIAERKHDWHGDELVALNNLWTWESGFSYKADNPTSHAYGIAQCMTNLHSDCNTERYFSSPEYQIRWGLRYLDVKYNLPSIAWSKHQARCPSSLGCWY